jgi:hypothetical protein
VVHRSSVPVLLLRAIPVAMNELSIATKTAQKTT